MAKVTSKFQVTVPKAIASNYGIRPGDEIDWIAAGEVIRVVPPGSKRVAPDTATRLHFFDQATARQALRQRSGARVRSSDRGWRREDLYSRGRSR
ncbi:MAG: AbrB/MazE/SpoVT family DNA-binding domain-containing protein [Acidobacteria bacterium]|nr:AbrB/MazE/SpoVT family DNA-binding domain-containing protein [Acidobacteriota bacterium]